eukprot:8979204-Prorocentrum_lima.AAC.1
MEEAAASFWGPERASGLASPFSPSSFSSMVQQDSGSLWSALRGAPRWPLRPSCGTALWVSFGSCRAAYFVEFFAVVAF